MGKSNLANGGVVEATGVGATRESRAGARVYRRVPSRGAVYIHSAPKALCPHVEWALGRALGRAVHLDWQDQPVLRGAQRAELGWTGPAGAGAAIASGLRGWEHLRYEVTQDPDAAGEGGRWMHTPDLGVFYAQTDSIGSLILSEHRIRSAIEEASSNQVSLERLLAVALGEAWDRELEPFRGAGDGGQVVWLHEVG